MSFQPLFKHSWKRSKLLITRFCRRIQSQWYRFPRFWDWNPFIRTVSHSQIKSNLFAIERMNFVFQRKTSLWDRSSNVLSSAILDKHSPAKKAHSWQLQRDSAETKWRQWHLLQIKKIWSEEGKKKISFAMSAQGKTVTSVCASWTSSFFEEHPKLFSKRTAFGN